MKIKWKYACHFCLAPLDPYYTHGQGWELRLFDMYLRQTVPPLELNNGHILQGLRVCKCCFMNGPIKYNPRIDALRQIGAIKFGRPKTFAVTRPELIAWIKNFYMILDENKPK
ncbi:hypothetical protein AP053_gp204 [Ostreococcus mediterraneus virus 1]|uniref:hypothetical protein n=1 Tax=Ostreococcus mediterraneus virus 1 TaxID=1663210 RepID=UPI0006D0D884|nr:hypothetical protein AP053_gp204 [Ostreococcus mediterraneus virus 1]ALI95341.1 hypothetical protein OmV1_230c [Ostreococcus mediterraneus virus 1]